MRYSIQNSILLSNILYQKLNIIFVTYIIVKSEHFSRHSTLFLLQNKCKKTYE